MKEARWSVVMLAILLSLPLLPVLMEKASGGKPIFAANVLAVWDDRTFDQVPMDMEVDHNGRIYISYHTNPKFYWNSRLVHSDDGGATWSRSVRVDDVLRDGNASNDASDQSCPRIAIAANDTVYAVWADHRDKDFTQQIRLAWSEDGENFSRSVRVDQLKDQPIWHGANPDIAINGDGRIFVVWMDRNLSGSYWNVWCSYSTDAGLTWAPMKLINTDGYYYRQHENVRCAMSGNDVYVVWHDNHNDGQYRPYLAVSHDGGVTFQKEKAVSDDLEQFKSRQWPSLDVDDSGRLYMAWRDKRTGADEIWFAKSTDKGATISMNKRITVAPEDNEDWYPSVAATGNGIVSITWQRHVPSKETTDEGEIFYINSTDAGETWQQIMRVDDTDRYWNDISLQEMPIHTYDLSRRAIVAWPDERDSYNYYKDIYFSRHSGDLSGPNHRPLIYDTGFVGNFTFNREVGSAVSPFKFFCNYSDEDNDIPIPGYPRVHIFNDSAGNDPVLDLPVVMNKKYPTDYDHIDGAFYEARFPIPSQGRVYYSIEVVEERDPAPVSTPIMEGPLIDAFPPKLTILSPTPKVWISSDTVRCSVRIEDLEGGNIDNATIGVRKSLSGLENLEKAVPVKGFLRTDNNTYTAWADVKLSAGIENYVVFEAKDRVKNGPGRSDPINIWVDNEAPYFTNAKPTKIQLYENVNCSIDWVDHVPGSTNVISSGLNLSTIEYAYRTTTSPANDWRRPEGIIALPKGIFRCWVHLNFENDGVYNYIRWKARDNLSQESVTGEYRIRVDVPENYPPRFVGGAYPSAVVSRTPHLFWDDAFDEEGNRLYYRVRLLRNDLPLTKVIDVGERTFYDVSDENAFSAPGYYTLEVNVTDHYGGWDILLHEFRVMDAGTPPPADVPYVGPYYTRTLDRTIAWTPSPSWSDMNVTYMVRVGSSDWRGDVLDWTGTGPNSSFDISGLNISVGVYSIQLMAESNRNFSRVTQTTLKLNDYDLEAEIPSEFGSIRGRGDAIKLEITNFATFSDNVTIVLGGELVERRWAYLAANGERSGMFNLPSQKNITIPSSSKVLITVFTPGDAPKKTYTLTVRIMSEDGETDLLENNISVKVADRPPEGTGNEITDTLYKMITDLLPFLKPVSPRLLVGIFFVLVIAIIAGVAVLGINMFKKRKKAGEDPYAEQRKLYRELYGAEPTQEQLEKMKEESVVEDVMKGVVESPVQPSPPKKSTFDESFLGSEKKEAPPHKEAPKEPKAPVDSEEEAEDWGK